MCETLDRVLNKGAVVFGDVIISIADIDLIYLGLNLILCSVETMSVWDQKKPAARIGASASATGARGGI